MKNPLLDQLHNLQKNKIIQQFPELNAETNPSIIFLYKYLNSRPSRFYSRKAYQIYYKALLTISETHSAKLNKYYKEYSADINSAFDNAKKINALNWHDQKIEEKNNYNSLILIDHEVHPAYLRLVETVFRPMLHIPAYFSRLTKKKKTEGLDLYNLVAELADEQFNIIKAPYVHIIRNGIAHGGINYSENEIIYRDKKNNTQAFDIKDVIKKFDDMLDVCNGLLLAYSIFALSQSGRNNLVPQSLLIEELCAITRTPYWKIAGALTSKRADGQSQLIIYCNVQTMDNFKVLFSTFQTAILAEKAMPDYEHYFISMEGINNCSGYARFDGPQLASHRLCGHDIKMYKGMEHEYEPLFLVNEKIPKFIHRLETLKFAFQITLPIVLSKIRSKSQEPMITIRNSSVHRNSWGLVLKADVVIELSTKAVDKNCVRNNCRKVITLARKTVLKQLPWYSPIRYLPLGFAKINIFCSDYRARYLSNFGLGEDLVGSIQIQRIRRIKSPDFFGSTVEIWKKYRIAWNSKWLAKQ